MNKKIAAMEEPTKAMQRRIDKVENKGEQNQNQVPSGNAATGQADHDKTSPAALAGAAVGLSTDQEFGSNLGVSTGTGYHSHVGGSGTAPKSNP